MIMSRSQTDQPMKALFWMSLSALGFSTMAISVKRLGPLIPELELVFFRSILNLLFVLSLMFLRSEKLFPEPLKIRKNKGSSALKLHLLLIFRGMMGFGGIYCLFYSIHHLPLPIAMMLGWCSPLFVIFFSRLFLGERLPPTSWIAVLLAFVGLFFLLNPLGWGLASGVPPVVSPATLMIGLLGAAMSGSAYVAVRAATAQVGVNLIVLYFMGVATLISSPMALSHFQGISVVSGFEVLFIGLMAAVGQVAMTHGYRFAPASQVSTMSLLNAVFSAIFGWLIFGERLAVLQWGGMLVLGLAIASLTWCKPR